IIDSDNKKYDSFTIKYFYDKSTNLTIDDIKHHNFEKQTTNSFTFGYIDGVTWFKIEVENRSDKEDYILTFNEPIWKKFDLYYKKDALFIKELNGLDIPLSKRSIKDVNPTFNIHIDKNTTQVFYIKSQTIASQIGEFKIVSEKDYYNPSKITTTHLYIIFAFILMIIIILNIYSYILTKDSSYLYYIAYTVASLVFSSMHSGSYLLLGFNGWNEGLHVIGAFVILFLLLFSNKFLDLKNHLPYINKFFIFSGVIFLIFALLIYNNVNYASVLFNIYSALFFIVLFFAVIKVFLQGYTTAKYYLIALLIYAPLMGLMIATFNTFLDYSYFTRHSFLLGTLIEIIFFTLILTSKYRSLNLEKIKIQSELIYEKEKNEKFLESEILKRTKEIERQNSKFKTIYNTSKDGLALLDMKTKYLEVNKSYANMLGYTPEELIGTICSSIILKESDKNDIDIAEMLRKNGSITDFEKKCTKKDGSIIIVNISASMMTHGDTMLISARDITNQKRQNKMVFEQNKMASMGEMIGNIAHQWRQPLSIISTASSGMLLQKEHNILSDEEFKKMCISIDTNAQYLSKTIDDFKNFIKNDKVKKRFNLKNNINSFLNLVDGSIKSCNLNVVLDLQDDIDIDGYENELTQCLINIFNNAKDILEEKEEDDRLIFISTSTKNSKAIINIRDSGGGIPKDIIDKIFEPYFTTKHQSQGTGLGLHMTYNLVVDGMRGTIDTSNKTYTYQDKKYTGAEFIIILPLS
ncbi:MAG: 7TM diverse intracellular signaling domain-containing protein, partial [Campylobacterota bacterium]|nr:7TM diverse intracellular signaling domain-containing protein [Campylobacterota bacterium]